MTCAKCYRRMTTLLVIIPVLVARLDAGVINIDPAEGWVIFDPNKDGFAYRYGPSITIKEDRSIDAWFASPGDKGSDGIHQWDWLRHKRSTDGGRTWTTETVVLKATEGSRDRMAVCDPGIIKLGDLYYLGYTATAVDNNGLTNEVFVARSKSPTGGFEKWNGKGWGGMPAAIVEFTTPTKAWGVGEPSFVRKKKTLFIYYTWSSFDGKDRPVAETRVATAPADDPNWPGKLTFRGTAFKRQKDEDSADVKYVDAARRFIAVSAGDRFTTHSYIAARESSDGIRFGEAARVTRYVKLRCHNAGISGTPDGHISLRDANFIAYAYSDGSRPGNSWAFWHTYLNPIKITVAPRHER